jgi:hypothetical protein
VHVSGVGAGMGIAICSHFNIVSSIYHSRIRD